MLGNLNFLDMNVENSEIMKKEFSYSNERNQKEENEILAMKLLFDKKNVPNLDLALSSNDNNMPEYVNEGYLQSPKKMIYVQSRFTRKVGSLIDLDLDTSDHKFKVF